MDRCLNCNQPIRLINYAMGPQWMHVNPDASFPTEHKGTAWRHCKGKVATPAPSGSDEQGNRPATPDANGVRGHQGRCGAMSDNMPKSQRCPIGPMGLHTYNYERTECIWCGPNGLGGKPGVWVPNGDGTSAWSIVLPTAEPGDQP